eukprot:4616779-Prymnesium_polylepis.1
MERTQAAADLVVWLFERGVPADAVGADAVGAFGCVAFAVVGFAVIAGAGTGMNKQTRELESFFAFAGSITGTLSTGRKHGHILRADARDRDGEAS